MKKETKNEALSLIGTATMLFLAWPIGLLVGLWFLMGRMRKGVRLLHIERFPKLENLQKVIIVSNHPSVIDPFLVAGLLFRYYLFHPLKHSPLIVADRINFYDRWWFWPLRSVMIPVDRDDKRKQAFALLKIKKAIDCGRMIIIFPEGGRTFKGNEWLYCQNGNDQNGGRIRPLRGGVGLLVQKTGAMVLPIGIVGSDGIVPNSKYKLWTRFNPFKTVTINIGEPIIFETKLSRDEITQQISARLLTLINEAL